MSSGSQPCRPRQRLRSRATREGEPSHRRRAVELPGSERQGMARTSKPSLSAARQAFSALASRPSPALSSSNCGRCNGANASVRANIMRASLLSWRQAGSRIRWTSCRLPAPRGGRHPSGRAAEPRRSPARLARLRGAHRAARCARCRGSPPRRRHPRRQPSRRCRRRFVATPFPSDAARHPSAVTANKTPAASGLDPMGDDAAVGERAASPVLHRAVAVPPGVRHDPEHAVRCHGDGRGAAGMRYASRIRRRTGWRRRRWPAMACRRGPPPTYSRTRPVLPPSRRVSRETAVAGRLSRRSRAPRASRQAPRPRRGPDLAARPSRVRLQPRRGGRDLDRRRARWRRAAPCRSVCQGRCRRPNRSARSSLRHGPSSHCRRWPDH